MKTFTRLAVLILVLAAAACSDPEEATITPVADSATVQQTDQEPDPEPDSAEQACELLIEGQDLGGTQVRPIALTTEGGVLDEDWSWGTLLVSIAMSARDSDDAQVSAIANQITDYGAGEVSRKDLYAAALDLLGACQDAGYVDTEWVAIPWPSDEAIQQFLLGIAMTVDGNESALFAEDSPAFDLGLESCQAVADEHNVSGTVPDWDWLYDEMIVLSEVKGYSMDEAIAISMGAIASFCSDYEQIIDDAR